MRSFSSQSYTQNPARLVACLCISQHTEGKSEREDINGKVEKREAWKDSIVYKKKKIKKSFRGKKRKEAGLWPCGSSFNQILVFSWCTLKVRTLKEFLLWCKWTKDPQRRITWMVHSWSSCTKIWTEEECKHIVPPPTAITCDECVRIKQDICRLFGLSMISSMQICGIPFHQDLMLSCQGLFFPSFSPFSATASSDFPFTFSP